MATKKEIFERYRNILSLLGDKGELTTQEIKQVLGVNEKIVWQTIKDLDDMGIVQKMHGGVRSKAPIKTTEFYRHLAENPGPKHSIARRVITGILRQTFADSKMCIYLDSGSTSLILYREIVKDPTLKNLTFKIVSNNTSFTHEPCPDNVVLILSGGQYSCEDECLIGQAKDMFPNYPAKYAFLSASNLSYTGGFLGYNPGESKVKEAMIQNAEEIIILADSAKFRFTGGELIARFEWTGEDKKHLTLLPKEGASKPVRIITDESPQKEEILNGFMDSEKGITRKEVEECVLFAPSYK